MHVSKGLGWPVKVSVDPQPSVLLRESLHFNTYHCMDQWSSRLCSAEPWKTNKRSNTEEGMCVCDCLCVDRGGTLQEAVFTVDLLCHCLSSMIKSSAEQPQCLCKITNEFLHFQEMHLMTSICLYRMPKAQLRI